MRPRAGPRGDVDARAAASMRTVLREAENRFLALQTTAAESAPAVVLSAYLNILADLGSVAERLHEASVRRDVSFLADRRLAFLDEHCRWLARRVSAEFMLILQVHLEQDLRETISPEAYQKFLRLEEVEDAATEVEALSDKDLMGKLRIGTLFSEILDQVDLDHMRGWPRHRAMPVLSMDESLIGE
jgi:hypothetical protein